MALSVRGGPLKWCILSNRAEAGACGTPLELAVMTILLSASKASLCLRGGEQF